MYLRTWQCWNENHGDVHLLHYRKIVQSKKQLTDCNIHYSNKHLSLIKHINAIKSFHTRMHAKFYYIHVVTHMPGPAYAVLLCTHYTSDFSSFMIRRARNTNASSFYCVDNSRRSTSCASWYGLWILVIALKHSPCVWLSIWCQVAIVLSGPWAWASDSSWYHQDGWPCWSVADGAWSIMVVNRWEGSRSTGSSLILCSIQVTSPSLISGLVA